MILLRNFGNIFKIPELTRKIFFTLGVLVIYRIGVLIPAIGINTNLLVESMKKSTGFSGFLGYFDMVSGGAMQLCTIFALGVGPYITASIMMQILSLSVPSLEALAKEGEYGRKQINQYTRYLALALSITYSFSYANYLTHLNATQIPGLLLTSGIGFKLLFTLTLTTGAMVAMWLGEQISLFGIGNGSSMIIFASIVARFPEGVRRLIESVQDGRLNIIVAILILVGFVVLSACIVFLEKGDRKIPVQYARRIIGQRVYGGQSTYIPFKINTAGVMPVIFAQTLVNIPFFIFGFLGERIKWLKPLADIFAGGFLYNALEFALIILFTYFYTAIAFNPVELADNIKKSGGFIPGIRPGTQTANFFDYILNRIGLVGAIYLGVLAITPNILGYIFNLPFSVSGTSLLIMVGVALETSSQIESYLIEHKYSGFLSSGRIKSKAIR